VLALPSLWTATRGGPKRLCLLGAVALVPLVGMGIYVGLFRGQVWMVTSELWDTIGEWGSGDTPTFSTCSRFAAKLGRSIQLVSGVTAVAHPGGARTGVAAESTERAARCQMC